LREQIEKLKDYNRDNEDMVKTLSEKREQALREIQRLEKRLENGGNPQGLQQAKSPTLTVNTMSTQNTAPQVPSEKDKSKKVAEKALRGFDILSKQI
jgi:hypothetical protein